MSKERWLDVVQYQGYYQVSDLARVRSVARVYMRWGRPVRVRSRIIKQTKKTAYPMVGLHRNGKQEIAYVHHLVWEAFNGELPGGHAVEVNHKDNDKYNAKLSNLELVTKSGNRHHALRCGALKSEVLSNLTKMLRKEYAEARRYPSGRIISGELIRIAKKYGVTVRKILKMKNRRPWEIDGAQTFDS